MSIRYPQRWYPCERCQEVTQHAIVGNRLLSRWDVARLPADGAPAVSWRCAAHRRYKMRSAAAMWANQYGDLCSRLVCGHQTCWIFRDDFAYTQRMIERGLATGELQLAKRQRCFVCADLEMKEVAE